MRALLLVSIALLTGCPPPPPPPPPTVPITHCNPEVCDAPRDCHPQDQVCVHVCEPGGVHCKVDEFAQVSSVGATQTCTCVPQRPGGRGCADDTQCVWGPDETQQSPEHLCVVIGGASSTCHPLGVACRSNSDCSGGLVCNASRLCAAPEVPPPPPQLAYRLDADQDGLCTAEIRLAPEPGPGPGWRTDCAGEERAECDDYRTFICAPTDVDLFGRVETVGTAHNPALNLIDDAGTRYDLVGPAVRDLSRHGGGARIRIASRVAGTSVVGPKLTVTGWWIVGLPGGVVPRTGRVWRENGQWFFEDAGGRVPVVTRRLTDADDGWKIWSVGRMEGGAYHISRHMRVYKPDVP